MEDWERLRLKNAEADRILAAGSLAEASSGKKPASKGTIPLQIICLVVFCWCVWGLGNHFWLQYRFTHEGDTTIGLIVRTVRSRYVSTADYVYFANGKNQRATTDYYAGSDANASNQITVRYLIADPQQSEIVGRENYLLKILLYVFGIVMGGGAFIGARWKPHSAPVVYDPNEPLEGPEWATKPYQSVVTPKSRSTDPVPVDEELLNPLPGDKRD